MTEPMVSDSRDPRTVGVTARFHLPHPLAALYQMVLTQHRPGLRYGFLLRLGEGMVRFLAYLAVADAAAQGVAPKKMSSWWKSLNAPGLGKLHGILRSTNAFLAEARDPVIPELGELIDDDWNQAIDAVITARNRYAHDRYVVPDGQAAAEIDELMAHFRVLLNHVQFLRNYQLGTCHAPRRAGAGWFVHHWHGCRGQEEECPSQTLRLTTMLPEGVVLLLAPDRQRALVVSPFLHRVADRERGFMLWLTAHGPKGSGEVAYHHPVLNIETTRLLVDPDDPTGPGVTADEYLSRAADWHAPITFELDPSSLELLTGPQAPPSHDERYHVIGKLGEGAMGTVWEVEDVGLKRHTALKSLRPELARSATQIERFRREGEVLAKLRHPGLVEVYHLGFAEDGVPFIEMALLEGEALGERIQRTGPLPVDQALTILDGVLDALAYTHEQGVIHRDVKPSNVILCPEGPKLVDFGIAQVADATRLTQTASSMGTLGYMAPEQWQGEAGTRSDLYATARMLFELLTGKPPPAPAASLREELPELPEPLLAAYEKATAESPEERFESATDMRRALAAVAGLPLPEPPPPERAPSPAPAEPSSPLLEDKPPTDDSSPPSDPTAKAPGWRRLAIPAAVLVVAAAGVVVWLVMRGDEDGREDSTGPALPFPAKWVAIEGGEFTMGTDAGQPDEKPPHKVRVPSYHLWRDEVTVAEYQACVDAGRCLPPQPGPGCNFGDPERASHPINCVTVVQAEGFATFVGGRLPTEAEWEYAARSRGKDQRYPWGNQLPTCELAITSDESAGCGQNRTWPVGSIPAGNTAEGGLTDMAGNVWEWTADGHHESYEGAPADGSAWVGGRDRVARGGSWRDSASHCRAVNRGRFPASHDFIGFRVAR